MKIALTAWEDRISPVFDAARTLLIAHIENDRIVGRHYEPFNPGAVARLVDFLKALEIDVFICGAISQTPSIIIEAGGIRLISFIGGKIDDILESCTKDLRIVAKFSMPGCGRQNRHQQRRRNEYLKENKEVSHMPRGDGTGPQRQGGGQKGKGGCKTGRRGQGGGSGKGSGQGCGKGQGKSQGQGRGQKPGGKQPQNQSGE